MATRQREKAEQRRKDRDRRPHASVRYVRIAPNKVRLVIDLIRGKSVGDADAILANTPKAAAVVVRKLLKSAVANAENNMDLNADNLYVAEVFADEGPTLKRYIPRSRGMANRILKRSSHVTIILDQAN